jgi:deoxyribodipyrimidine photo-lyase
MQRLNHYFLKQNLSVYKETRNGKKVLFKIFLLAMGCISPRTIYKEIRAYEKENGANDSTYWLILNYYFCFMFKKYQTKLIYKRRKRKLTIFE